MQRPGTDGPSHCAEADRARERRHPHVRRCRLLFFLFLFSHCFLILGLSPPPPLFPLPLSLALSCTALLYPSVLLDILCVCVNTPEFLRWHSGALASRRGNPRSGAAPAADGRQTGGWRSVTTPLAKWRLPFTACSSIFVAVRLFLCGWRVSFCLFVERLGSCDNLIPLLPLQSWTRRRRTELETRLRASRFVPRTRKTTRKPWS